MTFAWQGDEAPYPATTLRLERVHLAFDMLAATALFRRHLAPAAGEQDRALQMEVNQKPLLST